MDERALKPCPFCGGEAKIMNLNHGTWVECSNYHYERHQVCVHAKTEAEAIAAWNTRTHGTLTAEQVRKCVRVGACDHGLWGALDEDTDWQTIADELNAELGSGTCELTETDSYSKANEVIHVLECSACGETCEHVNGSYPRCPHCGRKVVSA